jgi:hypothetical protein
MNVEANISAQRGRDHLFHGRIGEEVSCVKRKGWCSLVFLGHPVDLSVVRAARRAGLAKQITKARIAERFFGRSDNASTRVELPHNCFGDSALVGRSRFW